MSIPIVIPTLRMFDLAAAAVRSLWDGTVRPAWVLVVDNSGGDCPPIEGAIVVPGRQPQAVARAWNDGMARARGDAVLLNDDCIVAADTLALLLAGLAAAPRAGVVGAIPDQAFACCAVRWACYQDVGPFDEGFVPAYFEDDDYRRRMLLKGWDVTVMASDVYHAGSQTINASPETIAAHHPAFQALEKRYKRKWGGAPGRERYTAPWGGGHG